MTELRKGVSILQDLNARVPSAAIGVAFVCALSGGVGGQPTILERPGDPGPILRNDPKEFEEFEFRYDVRLLTPSLLYDGRLGINRTRPTIDRSSFVFPIPPETSAHAIVPDSFTGFIDINDTTLDDEPRLVEGYQGGVTLGVWEVGATEVRNADFVVSYEVVCFETVIDERRAGAIPWPDPEEAFGAIEQSLLEPQLFVESNAPIFAELVNRWTNGEPRSVPPYVLAKFLMGRAIETYDFNGDGRESTALFLETIDGFTATQEQVILGRPAGFEVAGALWVVEVLIRDDEQGSPLDLPNYLCALYRAAGIPARLVIGFEIDQRRIEDDDFPDPHAWVEFFLFDPEREVGEWIPADPIRQSRSRSDVPPIEEPWKFFGNNDEMDETIPVSLHWHPPTTVTNAGAPAIWGWLPEPETPPAAQLIDVGSEERDTEKSDRPIDNEIWLRRTGVPRHR